MRIMQFIAFFGFIVGAFCIIEIHPKELIEGLKGSKTIKKEPLKKQIKRITSPKKQKGIKKLISESKDILKATNRENAFATLSLLSFALMVGGAFVSIAMNNMLLVPVLAIGLSLMPFWYVKLTATKWKKELNNELETALSVITTSYMRSESIITAIEENINYINPPVYDVFKTFLLQTKLINANIKMALESLKPRIQSAVFHEWVDSVIDCQEDKNLKSTLTPIVTKLSDMRIVSAELDFQLYEPLKEFITMALLLIGNIPLMYFLNRDWFNTLMYTGIGKAVLAVCGVVLFISMAAVVNLSKPVEYKR
ncbi:type II secretion system F family protein [Anaerosolibacter sp.]|uniref:type II secretion system F family protein n=1 Tax=Anaerosolibacter sp. TaxID=1872527 RepID=UPI0039F0F360